MVYFAPQAGNELALGFDMGHEGRRRDALEEALRTQLPTASGPVFHGLKPDILKGFTIFHPVFERENSQRPRGFAVAAIRLESLFGYDRQKHELIRLSCSFLHANEGRELLMASGQDSSTKSSFEHIRPMFVYGKMFTLTAQPTDKFMLAHPIWKSWLVLLTGLAFTCTVSMMVNMVCTRRHELESLVEDRTNKLGITELRFNQLLAQSNTVLWECNADGLFTFVSPVAKAIYGHSPEELVGKHYFYSLHPTDGYDTFKAHAIALFASKKPFFDMINPLQNPSGEVVVVSTCGMPLLADNGTLLGYYGWDHNITDRVRMTEKLKQSQLAAEAASRAKSDFLINMSHEIRTPINGIVGCGELLKASGLNDEQHEYLDIITTSSQQLLLLINEILDFSRIETGRIELHQEDFNLRDILEGLASNLALANNTAAIELLCVIPPDLPVLLHGDAFHLQQVIMNLTSNALKFTEQGEVVISVRACNENHEDVTLEFMVSDSGIGIDRKHQKHIFDMFFQGDSSMKRRHGGAGLGLTIVKSLIDLMGGTIQFSSEPGHGAKFFFTLSMKKLQPARPEEKPLPPALKEAAVLVVAGHDSVREDILVRLTAKGIRAEGAADLPQAEATLAAAKAVSRPFCLAIVDTQFVIAMRHGAPANPLLAQAPWADIAVIPLCPLTYRPKAQSILGARSGHIIAKPVHSDELWKALQNAAENLNGGVIIKQVPDSPAPDTHVNTTPRPADAATADILLVEDNVVNQKVALAILKKMGYEADLAVNGLDALEILGRRHYRLVLMDVQMPEMDGIEATRIIRNRGSIVLDHDVVIVAMTAHAVNGYKESCLNAGMNDYIPKPITPVQVRDMLQHWLH